MNFMHFHNSCTHSSDHPILLVKAGKAHKERMVLQTIINAFKKYEGGGIQAQTKMMMAAK